MHELKGLAGWTLELVREGQAPGHLNSDVEDHAMGRHDPELSHAPAYFEEGWPDDVLHRDVAVVRLLTKVECSNEVRASKRGTCARFIGKVDQLCVVSSVEELQRHLSLKTRGSLAAREPDGCLRALAERPQQLIRTDDGTRQKLHTYTTVEWPDSASILGWALQTERFYVAVMLRSWGGSGSRCNVRE